MAFTADNLLSSIERRSFAPSNQSTFSSNEILALADELNLSLVVPNILTAREEYFIFKKDYDITANQAEYVIPPRAIGSSLRDVQIIDSNGSMRSVSHIEYDDQVSTSSGSLYGYFLKDDKVVLHRVPSSTDGTLRLSFFIQPGNLVLAASGAVISAINTSTKVVSVTTIPSTWVTGNIFDFITGRGSHAYRDIDLTSTLVSGTSITFGSLPSDLVVGDYVNLSEQSSLIQLPSPYRAVLAQLVAAEMLAAMSQPSADRAEKKARDLMNSALGLITPRVRGDVRVINSNQWF